MAIETSIKMSDQQVDLRDYLIGSLKGKKVILRDLQGLMDGWPEGVNSNVERLRKDVDNHLNR